MAMYLLRHPFMRSVLSPVLRLWHVLPQGHSLESEEWLRRHRRIVWLLWLHALAVPVFGLVISRYVSLGLIGGVGCCSKSFCRPMDL